jgi:phosphatidyl-myo-inositol dimannoside synthase
VRVAALVSEAFGGYGGIALYNRDLLGALCELPGSRGVTAVPRVLRADPQVLPEGLDFRDRAAAGAAAYLREWLRLLRAPAGYDLVICGHINLLPLAELVRRRYRSPLVLFIYGIDAWSPTGRGLTDWLAKRVDAVVAISELTRERFARWAGIAEASQFVVPNAIRVEDYGLGDKPTYLAQRYGLQGNQVLLTLGRLSAAERYKGIDEVLDLLPSLAVEFPSLRYLVIGEGDDRPRLEAKADALGVRQLVTFGGQIPEAEKADHYRLADAFVMAGRGEGFGFVFLEAMACGVPVVASIRDGSREAVRDGALGLLADPDDPESLRSAIRQALRQPRRIPQGLDYFAYPRFRERVSGVLAAVFRTSGTAG